MHSSFDKTPFVIGVLDENRRVRHITSDVADLLGYEPSECIGPRSTPSCTTTTVRCSMPPRTNG